VLVDYKYSIGVDKYNLFFSRDLKDPDNITLINLELYDTPIYKNPIISVNIYISLNIIEMRIEDHKENKVIEMTYYLDEEGKIISIKSQTK
jgi:hypothetical protein